MKLTASPAVDLAAVYGDSDRKLRNIVELTPTPLCIFKGADMVLETVNQAALDVWQMGWEVIGKRLVDIVPEMAAQPFLELMQRVYYKGVSEKGIEQPAYFVRADGNVEHAFFNFLYQPYREIDGQITGVVVMATDVTEHVKLRQQLEHEERRYKTLVKASSNTVWTADQHGMNGQYVEWWEKLTGKSVDPHDPWSWLASVHPDDRATARATWETSLQNLVEYRTAYRVLTVNNHYVHLAVNGVPIKNDDGTLREWIGTITDITERKRSEEALRRSEESLQRAVDSARMGIWELNLQTRVSNISQRAKEIFGFDPNETVTFQAVSERIAEEDRAGVLRAMDAAMDPNGNGVYQAEYTIRNGKDGLPRMIRAQAKTTFDAAGKPLTLVGTTMDITREKAAQQELERRVEERTDALRRQKEFADTVFNAVVDVLVVYDTEGRFVAVNKKAEEAYGMRRDEAIGKTFYEFFNTGTDTEGYRLFQRAARGERVHVPAYRSNVTGRYSETYLVPIMENNAVYAVLLVLHDITDLMEATEHTKAANAELADKNIELERTNRELRAFNFVASHDLQEPLRKIQIFSNRILNENTYNDATRDYLGRSISAAQRMQQLIDALMGFSQVAAGGREEPVPLNPLVREVWHDLKRQHDADDALLEMTDLPTLTGNPVQLRSLMQQLLDNALKYRKPDTPLRVRMSAASVPQSLVPMKHTDPRISYWRIEIKDNGIGFEQQYEHKIFELFQRLHRRHEYAGTGIGLTLCRKIVDNHRGFISAAGQPGVGTSVTVFLPESAPAS